MSGTSDFVGDGSLDDFVDTAVPALQGKNDPAKQDGYYAEASKKYNIPVPILKSLATVESSNGKHLLSPAGAKGMMGIMDGTKPTVGVENSYDPEQAIDGAANYLRQNLDKFGGNYTAALRAYNGGPGFTKLTPDSPGYAENTAYVGKVQQALKAQGVDPNIINQPDAGTKVAAAGGGVSSDSTSTYTAPAKASAEAPPTDNSLDDFVDGAIKDLAPPQAQAAAPQVPQQAPALAPNQAAQLAAIVAHPPQPDVVSPPPGQPQGAPGAVANGPPQGAVPPQAGVQVPPQSPQLAPPPPPSPGGPAPVQLAPPPPVAAPQDAQIPQPPGAANPQVPQAPPQATAPNVPTSVGPAFETANAMTLGAAKPVIAGIGAGIAGLEGQPVGGTYSANMNALNAGQSAYQAAHPVAAGVTNLLAPLPAEVAGGGLIGRAAGALGGFLPEAAQGAIRFLTGMGGTVEAPAGGRVAAQGIGNALTNIASKGTAGALQGGGAGLAGSGIDPDNKQSVKTQMLNGALAGGGLGTALGTVARTVLPAVAPDLAKMALLMKGYGIDLPTGALLGGHALSAAAGPGEQHSLEQAMSAWNRQMGSTADGKITSEIVDKAKSDAGNAIESVANQVGLQTASNPTVRHNFFNGMMQIGQQISTQISPKTEPEAFSKLTDAFDRMRSMLQSDVPGQQYTQATQTGGWISNLQKSTNPAISTYGNRIRSLVESALDQSAAASGNQDAVKTLQAARQHYRVAATIEPLADRAGAPGIIDPRLLANKFAGDAPGTATKILADGSRFLPSVDRVGNVKNNGGLLGMVARSHALPIVAGLAGGAGGYGIGDIPGALGGIAAAGGIEKIGEHVLNSPGYRNALLGAPTESKVGALARGALRAIPSTFESGAANLYRPHNPLTQP